MLRLALPLAASLALGACASRPLATVAEPVVPPAAATAIPAPPPTRWLGLLGEYGSGAAFRIVAEHEGRLRLVDTALRVTPLTERGESEFVTDPAGERVTFTRDARGRA